MYLSEASVPISSSDLVNISEKSCVNNKDHGLTGYLYYSNYRFIQYLEGQQEDLAGAMALIRSDYRHSILYTTESRAIHNRSFPSWYMNTINMQNTKFEHISDYMHEFNNIHDFDLHTNQLVNELANELLWQHLEQVKISA